MIHKEMLGCFNPCLGQMWTNPNVGFKRFIKKFKPTVGFVHILLQTWIFWEVARLFLSVFFLPCFWLVCSERLLGCCYVVAGVLC